MINNRLKISEGIRCQYLQANTLLRKLTVCSNLSKYNWLNSLHIQDGISLAVLLFFKLSGGTMKTLLTALALVVVSVNTLYAGVPQLVPEPSSLILLISGVGGLAFWLRRRR
jgi:hypothetical protein